MRFIDFDATGARTGKGRKKRIRIRRAHSKQTADAPALAFGDGDTGFWESADDVLHVGTAGAAAITVAADKTVTLAGNLVVSGTQTTVNSTTLTVDDKNLELGSVDTPSDTTADGGGITLKGATDKTFNWVDSTDSWTSSENINLASGKTFQLNGAAITSTAAELNLLNGVSGLVQADLTKLAAVDASAAELNYTDGVTSAIQTQMDAKLATTTAASTYAPKASPTFTGEVTVPTPTATGHAATKAYVDQTGGSSGHTVENAGTGLTARSKLNFDGTHVIATDDSGDDASDITLSTNLQALSGLTSAADKGIQFTGSGTAATYDLTAAGKALLDDASASAQRTTLGLVIGTDVQAYDATIVVDADIGTTVQAYDADLTALAGLTSAANKGIQFTGSGTASVYDLTAAGKALLDDANASAQRTTLGLGTAATRDVEDTLTDGSNLPDGAAIKAYGDANWAGGGGGGSAHTIENAGTGLTARSKLNFDGTHVIATDDSGDDASDITLSTNLQALSGLTSAADKGIQFTGSGAAAVYSLTTAGKALLDDADASAQRTTLGLGTSATRDVEDTLTDGSNLPDGAAIKAYGDANWAGGGGGGSAHTIENAGTGLTARSKLNFDGTHVIATDDSGDDASDITLSTNLQALSGLTSAANKGIQFTGSGTASVYDLTTAGKALLDDADAASQRITLGLVYGTHVQAYDADLAAIAGLTSAADKGIQFTGSGTAAVYDLTAAGKALLDDANASAQRTTLGLGTASTRAAEDTLTDGSNLPDGAAIKAYGDANWAGGGGGGTLTTKGDLESYTTTQARLAVGTNDYVLTADSSAAAGVAWKAPNLDSYAVDVVTTLPGSPNATTIYFVTG